MIKLRYLALNKPNYYLFSGQLMLLMANNNK